MSKIMQKTGKQEYRELVKILERIRRNAKTYSQEDLMFLEMKMYDLGGYGDSISSEISNLLPDEGPMLIEDNSGNIKTKLLK